MDGKLNYLRFLLSRNIRREMTFFPKVSKTAVFGEIAKGGPREHFQKRPIFWGNFGKLKKLEIQVVE